MLSFVPPFDAGQKWHSTTDPDLYTLGIALADAGSDGFVNLTTGRLHHNAYAASSGTPGFAKAGIGALDAIYYDFSVPTSGVYDLTFRGNISGVGYIVSESIGIGAASKGAAKIWTQSMITAFPSLKLEETLYETDLSTGALFADLAEAAFWELIKADEIKAAVDAMKAIAELTPVVAWEEGKDTFEYSFQTTLQADTSYRWVFSVMSSTASAALGTAGLASNLSIFDLDVNLQEVEVSKVSDRGMTGGVTLITHGFDSGAEGWVTEMANAIFWRATNMDQPRYVVDVTDPGHDGGPLSVVNTSHIGPSPTDPGTDFPEIVILLDWSDVSGQLFSGGEPGGYHRSTVDVAAAVAEKLVQSGFLSDLPTPIAELPFHLIGHSPGDR